MNFLERYVHNEKHRNGTPGASQWTIVKSGELAVFRRSEAEGWLMAASGFGLHVVNDIVAYLGISGADPSFIAKFVTSDEPVQWHGYPISTRGEPIPRSIAGDWLNKRLLSTPKIRKITRGQVCSL